MLIIFYFQASFLESFNKRIFTHRITLSYFRTHAIQFVLRSVFSIWHEWSWRQCVDTLSYTNRQQWLLKCWFHLSRHILKWARVFCVHASICDNGHSIRLKYPPKPTIFQHISHSKYIKQNPSYTLRNSIRIPNTRIFCPFDGLVFIQNFESIVSIYIYTIYAASIGIYG